MRRRTAAFSGLINVTGSLVTTWKPGVACNASLAAQTSYPPTAAQVGLLTVHSGV